MSAYPEDREWIAALNAERWKALSWRQKLRARFVTVSAFVSMREWRLAWIALVSR